MLHSHLAALRRYARDAARHRRDPAQRAARRALPAPLHPDWSSWPADGISMTWLGHATVLMRVHGTWIITDPVLGRRIGGSLGPLQVGVRRIVPPALRVKELPPIDVIAISHAHFDHLDIPTLRRLPRSAVVVASHHLGDLLTRFRDVRELSWGESTEVNGIRFESTPARHWGARMITDRHRGWGGFLMTSRGKRILFAGDTALTEGLRPLRAGGPVDLAIMPIGAYDPWITNHCSPEEAWSMARELDAAAFLPIHHSTFRLSRELLTEPLERLRAAAGADAHRIIISQLGGSWTMPDQDVP
jgi:L-ascorbate metabolism protein UlaG (beta-lactamase superfamily)